MQEVDSLSNLLATRRLVTLTGPGGVGKTRLAAEVTSQLPGVPVDRVWWVELATVQDLQRAWSKPRADLRS